MVEPFYRWDSYIFDRDRPIFLPAACLTSKPMSLSFLSCWFINLYGIQTLAFQFLWCPVFWIRSAESTDNHPLCNLAGFRSPLEDGLVCRFFASVDLWFRILKNRRIRSKRSLAGLPSTSFIPKEDNWSLTSKDFKLAHQNGHLFFGFWLREKSEITGPAGLVDGNAWPGQKKKNPWIRDSSSSRFPLLEWHKMHRPAKVLIRLSFKTRFARRFNPLIGKLHTLVKRAVHR